MNSPDIQPPDDLEPEGRGLQFWQRVTAAYELDPDEIEVLVESCRTLDLIDRLNAVVAEEGMTTTGSKGQPIVHPGVVEVRQQRFVLSRLLRQLEIPSEDDPVKATVRARQAARARWDRPGDRR